MIPIGSSDAQNIDPQVRVPIAAAAAGQPVVSTWPVLARLPDVSAKQGTRSQERGARELSRDQALACPSSPTGYRFDPPESFGPHMKTDQTAVAALATTTDRSRTTIHTSRQGEPWPATRRARAARPHTSILPASNLFSIRGSSQASALRSVAQFLLLFALVTVVGSSLLLIRTAGLWQAANPVKTPPVADQATALPAAAGPAGTRERPNTDLPELPTASRPHTESPPIGKDASDRTAGDQPQAADDFTALPYPTTAFPPAVIPEGTERLLPQVRTTDQPPAIARLPGYVLEAPLHQAHDERHEPSLH